MIGIALGRFQPFHLGHLEFISAARDRCDRLCIGITNPNPAEIRDTAAPERRLAPNNNPFCFFDRAMMIEAALRQTGWGIDDFILIPAPIEHPDDLAGFLPPPELAVFLTTIYDEWGEEKTRRLESLGYRSETMWRRSDSERLTSGTEVRALMRRNQPWEHLVPEAVAAYIHRRGISA